MNAHELVMALIRWCLYIKDLSVIDYRAFLEHIYFISICSNRLMHDDFKDAAYYAAIRKMLSQLALLLSQNVIIV